MSSAYRTMMLRAARAFDLGAVAVMLVAALPISSGSATWLSLERVLLIRVKVANVFLLLGFLALCAAVFSRCGFYQSHRLSGTRRPLAEAFAAVAMIVALLVLLRWPLRLSFATNRFIAVFAALSFCVLALSRVVVRRFLHLARVYGRNLRHVVVVGEGPQAAALAERLTRESGLGYRVVRIIDAKETRGDGRIASSF